MNSFVIVVLALIAAAQANTVYRRLKVEDRVVGGEEAVPNSIPYQAFLKMYAFGKSYPCGASLLTTTKVLTAAHCMSSLYDSIDVYLGAHNITKYEETQQIIPAISYVIHKDYILKNYTNDIAIVTLLWPAKINEYVQLTRLPTRADVGKTYAGELATVSGWGRISDATGYPNDVLRFVSSPVITNEECSKDYTSIIPSKICVDGRSHKVACHADSGGPLVIGDNRLQIGIVSHAHAIGCEYGYHVAYTRTTEYLDWIAENGDMQIN